MSDSRELGFGTSLMRAGITLLVLITTFLQAFAQELPRATIRVAVKTEAGPVAGAIATMNEAPLPTDQKGIDTAPLPPGKGGGGRHNRPAHRSGGRLGGLLRGR